MGAKSPGDIKEICDIVSPDYGIITSVGEQHIETFKSVDNVFKTKFELADAVGKKGGITLANLDSEGIRERADRRNDVSYFGEGTKYSAKNTFCGESGTTFDLCLDGGEFTVSTRLLGFHSVADILAAAAMAHILGVSDNDIKFAISSLKPTEHRLELKSYINGSLLIDDAYNSNPAGFRAALEVLRDFPGQRILVTPGMVELGERQEALNRELGAAAADCCDYAVLVGQRQAPPLREGLLSVGFPPDRLYVADTLTDGMAFIRTLPAAEKRTILLENDLPDNF